MTRFVIAALATVVLALPLSAAVPASPPAQALVDTWSVTEIARAAHGLPLGGRLLIESLVMDGRTEALDLERIRVFTEDAKIVVHGEDDEELVLPAPDNAYFRGRVVGAPGSLAFLTVRAEGEVRGVVQTEEGAFVLATAEGASGGPRRLEARSAPVAPRAGSAADDRAGTGFRCDSENLAAVPTPPVPRADAVAPTATAASYTARIAVETDWEFFQLFGNTPDATDYVADLIGYASGIYDAEIDTDLQVEHISLWTTSSDPWDHSSTTCGLYEFGRYWNDNRTDVSRTIAHFMSGRSNGGGIAWLGVLCQGAFNVNHGGACPGLTPQIDNYGGGYGYTGNLGGNFDPANPSPVWDIVGVSHEIGHNFDSPHTHCYNGLGGSSEPVDECFGSEDGCYSGPSTLPCSSPGSGCGTIMSYCHLLSPGLSNIDLTFGAGHPYGVLPQRVPDWMRAHTDAVAQFSTCLDRILPCEPLVLSGQVVSTSETFSVDCDLYAGNGFEVTGTSGVTVTLSGTRVILESGFSVTGGASLVVQTQ